MSAIASIRGRLATSLVGISLVWGLGVASVVWLMVRHEVDELLDNTLQESAEILYGLLSFHAAQLPLHGGGSLPAPPHEEHLVWQIVSAEQQVLLRSHRAPAEPLAGAAAAGFSNAGDDWRVFGMRFDDRGRRLLVAQRGTERREARLEAELLITGGALLVGIPCALWLRRRVRHELRPLLQLSQAVACHDPTDARSELPAPQREELVPMHEAIAQLGRRLARRMANERAFAAHAAHALRTPLAGMVMQLAAAQQRCNSEAPPFLQQSRASADRLRRVVAALLTMFRSGAELQIETVDLPSLVGHLPASTLQVVVEPSPALQADANLLAAALMNLLDNSLRMGASRVRIAARQDRGGQHLRVEDDGPGIADEQRQRLQAALDRQDYEGQTGLGLMLADLVCRAHGGSLLLLPSAGGFAADLDLSWPDPGRPMPAAAGAGVLA